MSRKCLISVEGGLGKNVMLTSILAEFKETKQYDELYVISPYYDVFKCCPAVTDAFSDGQGTLYQELVLDKECDIYWKEPYSNQRFIKKECHLFDAWAEELGFKLKNNPMDYKPDLSKIEEEFPDIKSIAEQLIVNEWKNDYIIVQFCGGQSPLNDTKNCSYDAKSEPLKRNYFKGQQIIDALKKKYPDTTIVHYALQNEPCYDKTVKVIVPYLTYVIFAKNAKAVIATDSSLQHISTGNCKNTTVIWGETRPEHFGYNCNHNICANHVLNSQPYFKPLGSSPSIVRMPEPEDVLSVSGLL